MNLVAASCHPKFLGLHILDTLSAQFHASYSQLELGSICVRGGSCKEQNHAKTIEPLRFCMCTNLAAREKSIAKPVPVFGMCVRPSDKDCFLANWTRRKHAQQRVRFLDYINITDLTSDGS